MTDYRSSLKSKLSDIESKRADLAKESERLLLALGVLNEIDSELIRDKPSSKQPKATDGTLIDSLISILRNRPLTTNDIYQRVTLERETSKPSVNTALYRLRQRGKVFKEDDLWSLMEPEDSTEPQPQP